MRLGQGMKKAIVNKAVKAKFTIEEEDALEKDLMQRFVDFLIEEGHILLKDVPDAYRGFCRAESCVYLDYKDEDGKSFSELRYSFNIGKTFLCKTSYIYVKREIYTEWDAFKNFYDFLSRREKFEMQLSAVVESANTTNQLLEILPELKDFLPSSEIRALVSVESIKSIQEILKK